jgi:tagatose-1,6-bisphosphate aldolase non-catalytic subunit AgaZ/GatZ
LPLHRALIDRARNASTPMTRAHRGVFVHQGVATATTRTIFVTPQPYFEFKSSPLSEAAMAWRGEQEETQQFFTDPCDQTVSLKKHG